MSGRYLTPLPRLLAATLETLINRLLAMDPGASESLSRLHNRVLGIALQGLGIDLFWTAVGEKMQVTAESENEPDTWIKGTPSALALLGQGGAARPGAVQIQGDAELARAFQELFSRLDPDWEEALAQRFGDVLGHQLARQVRGAVDGLRRFGRDTAAMTADYLRDESRLLLSAAELEPFLEAVDDVRDECERLEARLKRLEQQRP
ncbi:MAG: SCP2 sterol-binding domain-containing protein [Wenzhouxiangellaceae bacterium]